MWSLAKAPLLWTTWLLIVWVVLPLGCGGTTGRAPLNAEQFDLIKPGLALSEAEAVLGPSRAPRRAEADALEQLIDNMPPHIQSKAQQDRSVAWGGPEGFVVAKVDSEGKLWVVSSRRGTPRTNQ